MKLPRLLSSACCPPPAAPRRLLRVSALANATIAAALFAAFSSATAAPMDARLRCPRVYKCPYITDGLVAWYDGIWNAGMGKHDANATVWIDLINGKTLAFNGNYTVNADNLYIPEGSYAHGSTISHIGADTIEMVIQATSHPANSAAFDWRSSSSSSSYARLLLYGWDNANLQNYGAYAKSDGTFCAQSSIVGNRVSVSFVDSLASYSGWLNGEQKTSKTGQTGTDAGAAYLWLNYYVGKYTMSANYHCIRIYNRALTADEIAHNYAVDKERFGL